MGLNHPNSLEDWQRWARPSMRRRLMATVLHRTDAPQESLRLLTYGTSPAVLAALDSATLSGTAAGLRPLCHRGRGDAAVLCPPTVAVAVREALGEPDDDRPVASADDLDTFRGSVRAVLSLGHFLRAGEISYEWSQRSGVEYAVAQHGLVTPFAPPLPSECTVYAFSDEDGEFWGASGAGRIVRPVGSQMLWEAAAEGRALVRDVSAPAVYLGQLHGRELGRVSVTRQTVGFLRAHPEVLYRPHPAEQDVLSRATHRAMRRTGVRFEDSGRRLPDLGADVVALFSTGVIEAAAQGRRGWVHHTAPPAWLAEFWSRYRMAQWTPGLAASEQPARTPAPDRPDVEPAWAIARDLFGEESA